MTEIEKIPITAEHLTTLRKIYSACEGMRDEQIIEALLFYESQFINGRRNIITALCYPEFDCHLHHIKQKSLFL